jgi:hypothetical protein
VAHRIEGDITSTYDWKMNAERFSCETKTVTPHAGSPLYFKCNIAIPVLPAGRQRLYLAHKDSFWDTTGIGTQLRTTQVSAADKGSLKGGVPPDAKVVDRTRRYVNKRAA